MPLPLRHFLPVLFVRLMGIGPNKVPGALLFLKVSPQATAFFWRGGRRPVLLRNWFEVHACAFLCLWNLNLRDPTWSAVSIRPEPPLCQLLSSADVAPTLTVQVKQNKRPRSLDVVKQKCVLAVNTGGRRLCKQAWFLWLSWSRGGQFVVTLFRCTPPTTPIAAPFLHAETAVVCPRRNAAGGKELTTLLHKANKPTYSWSGVGQASIENILYILKCLFSPERLFY